MFLRAAFMLCLALPASLASAGSDAWQKRRDGADKAAGKKMLEIPGGVTVTYTGKGPTPNNSLLNIDESKLPGLADLLDSLRLLRKREELLALTACASVTKPLETKPLRFDKVEGGMGIEVGSAKVIKERPIRIVNYKPMEIEMPASYLKDPPTTEVTDFVARHIAIGIVEECIRRKMRKLHEETEGIYADGIIDTADEHEARRWAETANAMIDGLTANFGGTIGYAAASLLTSDPDRIAGATKFGANVGNAAGAAKLQSMTK